MEKRKTKQLKKYIKLAPQAGFEPATYRLTAGRSAVELLRNLIGISIILNRDKPVKRFVFIIQGNRVNVCSASGAAVYEAPSLLSGVFFPW